ncbi:MAG: hypothetical protein ACP5P1_08940 [Acidimicrobiales bacterium]
MVVNLSEWADWVGVNKHTAYRWYREGKLPVPAQRVGRLILVNIDGAGSAQNTRTVLYARVSSHDQRADLDRQVAGKPATQSARKLVFGHATHRQGVVAGDRTTVVYQDKGPG